jgi:hypothetical protein
MKQTLYEIIRDRDDAMTRTFEHGACRDSETFRKCSLLYVKDVAEYLEYLGANEYLAVFNSFVSAAIIGQLSLDCFFKSKDSYRLCAIKIFSMSILPAFNECMMSMRVEGKIN